MSNTPYTMICHSDPSDSLEVTPQGGRVEVRVVDHLYNESRYVDITNEDWLEFITKEAQRLKLI